MRCCARTWGEIDEETVRNDVDADGVAGGDLCGGAAGRRGGIRVLAGERDRWNDGGHEAKRREVEGRGFHVQSVPVCEGVRAAHHRAGEPLPAQGRSFTPSTRTTKRGSPKSRWRT